MTELALFGAGRIGKIHAANISALPELKLQYVVDIHSEAATQLAAECDAKVSTVDKVFSDRQIKAIVIATNPDSHFDLIVQACRSGKHIFCEKPIALDIEKAMQCLAAAKQAAVTCFVGLQKRYDPTFQSLKARIDAGQIGQDESYQDAYQKIRAGQIGQPYLIRADTCDLYDPSGFFVRFAPTSGGIFLDCSIHDIDLARWLLGDLNPKRVMATGGNAIHKELSQFKDVDTGMAIVEFDQDRLAVFYVTRIMACGHDATTEIIGTKGKLVVGRDQSQNRLQIYEKGGVRYECTPSFYHRFEQAFIKEASEFIAAILEKTPPPLTLTDASEATKIGLALAAAQQSGQPILMSQFHPS